MLKLSAASSSPALQVFEFIILFQVLLYTIALGHGEWNVVTACSSLFSLWQNMAEAVLFDFVGNIVASLASQAIQEIGLASNVRKDVEKLKNKLSAIKVVLLEAEEQQANNDAVNDWLREF
uniref:Disease resistance N-terminal domain-containing protein n=1 Tax=Nelumbo nucifera TaxID=4432 RepID=A0A822YFP7_NELNU|nr:TPA_asm: hypothetical protein HUJ06_031263 [Nelumbo nucifera]